jgi:hypothetical protein
MNIAARRALKEIQKRVAGGRYIVGPHFSQRMRERGVFWFEVKAIIDAPSSIRTDGKDDQDRDRWFLTGDTDAGEVEMLLVLDDSHIFFWTIYWS